MNHRSGGGGGYTNLAPSSYGGGGRVAAAPPMPPSHPRGGVPMSSSAAPSGYYASSNQGGYAADNAPRGANFMREGRYDTSSTVYSGYGSQGGYPGGQTNLPDRGGYRELGGGGIPPPPPRQGYSNGGGYGGGYQYEAPLPRHNSGYPPGGLTPPQPPNISEHRHQRGGFNPMMGGRDPGMSHGSHSMRTQVNQFDDRSYPPGPASQAINESGFKGDPRRAPDLYDPMDSYRVNESAHTLGPQHRYHDDKQDYEMGRNRTSRDDFNSSQRGQNLPRDQEGGYYRFDDKRPEMSRDIRGDSRRYDHVGQDGRREAELRREKEKLLEEKRKEDAMKKELQRKEEQQKRLEEQRIKEQERKIEEQRKREREQKERERKQRERERIEREERKKMEELKEKEAKLRRLEELAIKEKELKEKERKLKEDMRRKEEEDRRLAEMERRQMEELKRREAEEERRRREKEEFERMERRKIQEEEEKLERMIRDRERKLREREEELLRMEQMTELRERENYRDMENIERRERQRMQELYEKQRELEEMEMRQRELELIELKEKALREKEQLHRGFHSSDRSYRGSSTRNSHVESTKDRSIRSSSSNKKYSKDDSSRARSSSSKRPYDSKKPGVGKPDKKNKSAFQRLDAIDVDNTKKDDADEKRGSAFQRLGEKISIKSRLGGKFSTRKAVPTASGMEITVENREMEMEVLDEIGQVDDDDMYLAEQREKERKLKERLQKELSSKDGKTKSADENPDKTMEEKKSTNGTDKGEKRKSEGETAGLDNVVIKKRAKTPASNSENNSGGKSLTVHTPTNMVGQLAMILKDLPKPAIEAKVLSENEKSTLKKKFTKKYSQSEIPDKILLLALANVNYEESMANLLVSKLIKQMSAPADNNTQSPVQEVDLNENGDEEKLDYEVD